MCAIRTTVDVQSVVSVTVLYANEFGTLQGEPITEINLSVVVVVFFFVGDHSGNVFTECVLSAGHRHCCETSTITHPMIQ